LNLSQHGREVIKEHEGLRLDRYLDPVGVATIGWGHTRTARNVLRITLEEAQTLFNQDVADAENCIRRNVTVELTQGQFDALVSLVFNIGCGAFSRSTLLDLLNRELHRLAYDQFSRWVHAGGRRLPGLVRRRNDERVLWKRREVT
jgi:lysozyme